jgi:hypothetical protein
MLDIFSPHPKPTLARELRDRQDWSTLACKMNDGGTSLDEEHLKSPAGSIGPNGKDFKDKAEGGGDIGNGNEEEYCQGSNCKPHQSERKSEE